MVAIAGLLLIVALSLVVTRVATVILVATGMSKESARFQARSALSGAGFTTRESELVVEHPLRRKVIAQLMLIGSAGVVAGIGSLIIGFRSGGLGSSALRLLELVAGLLLLVAVSRSRWVDERLTRAISQLLRRFTTIPTRDVYGLLQLTGDYTVSELAVCDRDWAAGRALADLELREEGVVVLAVSRKDGPFVGAPTGQTIVSAGDTLVVYGRAEHLAELDDRPAGPAGQRAHDLAMERQRLLEARQQARRSP